MPDHTEYQRRAGMLIVDDQPDNLRLLSGILGKEGYILQQNIARIRISAWD